MTRGCVILAAMSSRSRRALIIATLGLLASAPAASAQDPGVVLDPDSPSSKEYVIPLEDARRGADPARSESDEVVQGSRSSAPFGEGIGSGGEQGGTASQPGSSTGGGSSRDGDGDRRSGRDRSKRGTSLPPEVLSAAARPPTPDSGAGSLFLYGAGGLMVVLLGAVLGVLYRRHTAS